MSTETSKLAGQPDSESAFSIERVNAALRGTMFAGKVHHFTTIDSTQTHALAGAAAGVESGHVYLADEQTAGRGRGGHAWHSEPDRGLYLTALVRPDLRSNEVLQLSLAAGLAVQRAVLQVAGIAIDLRWPNDLVVPSADAPSLKVGGILIESASSALGTVRYAAIGIGVNLNQAEFNAELRATATSLRLAAGRPIHREAVAIALLFALDQEMQQIGTEASVLERFSAASSWAKGKRVSVAEDESYTGVTDGLTPDGLLRVRTPNGTVRLVRHGGVREDFS